MNKITCRNCQAILAKNHNSWACQTCRSSYVDFSFILNHFGQKLHDQILIESQNLQMKSRHTCSFCDQHMATHILFSAVQIESCFGCQLIWFDAGEIRKLHSLKQHEGLKLPGSEIFNPTKADPRDSALVTLAKKSPLGATIIMALICFIILKACENNHRFRIYKRPLFFRWSSY